MTHHDPTQNFFAVASCKEVPRLSVQRERVECHRCGAITNVAVRAEFIDWRKVSEDYRTQLTKLITDHNAMMDEMDLIYGYDNPAAVYYRNKWAMFMLGVRKHFGMDTRGTSAHLGTRDE